MNTLTHLPPWAPDRMEFYGDGTRMEWFFPNNCVLVLILNHAVYPVHTGFVTLIWDSEDFEVERDLYL